MARFPWITTSSIQFVRDLYRGEERCKFCVGVNDKSSILQMCKDTLGGTKTRKGHEQSSTHVEIIALARRQQSISEALRHLADSAISCEADALLQAALAARFVSFGVPYTAIPQLLDATGLALVKNVSSMPRKTSLQTVQHAPRADGGQGQCSCHCWRRSSEQHRVRASSVPLQPEFYRANLHPRVGPPGPATAYALVKMRPPNRSRHSSGQAPRHSESLACDVARFARTQLGRRTFQHPTCKTRITFSRFPTKPAPCMARR